MVDIPAYVDSNNLCPGVHATFWRNDPPETSMRVGLLGDRLMPQLDNNEIGPHKTVRGWVLLDVSSEYDTAIRPLTFRVHIEDTAGHKATIIAVSGGKSGGDVGPQRGISTTGPIDITKFTIRHLIDARAN